MGLVRKARPEPAKELECRACRSPMMLIDVEIDIKKHIIRDVWKCRGDSIPHVFKFIGSWGWR